MKDLDQALDQAIEAINKHTQEIRDIDEQIAKRKDIISQVFSQMFCNKGVSSEV